MISYNLGRQHGHQTATDSLAVDVFLERADSIIRDVAASRVDVLLGR